MIPTKKLTQFMHNNEHNTQAGISFIEVLVVLLLVSVMMSFAIPRFLAMQKGRAKNEFFSQFAKLVTDSTHQAIINKKIHQIFWDINQHEIAVKIYDEKSEEKNKHKKFKTIDADVFHTNMKIPDSFKFHNFFINGNDEVQSGSTFNNAWTYIVPDGTSQPVMVNIEDESDNNKFCITINPFYSQVSLHHAFEKP
jgi:type II secretory pathway pseudopilin PulG